MTELSELFDYRTDAEGKRYMAVSVKGISLLGLSFANKGTAFTKQEREQLDLDGLLPPLVTTLQQQVERLYFSYRQQGDDIAKYQFLRAIQDRSAVLFYALLETHLQEMAPIIYTPTVGLAVQRFSSLYRTARGLTFSPENINRAEAIMRSYPLRDVRMIVVTDASAILGIGDQGMGGLSICIGKLSLYTVGGGLSPYQSLPINLDVGTNRAELLDDPHYLGIRQPRLQHQAYFDLVDQFVAAVKTVWPKAIVQWEDFTRDAAFNVLARYRDALPCFNDDIQGTGAMALAGLLSAVKRKQQQLQQQTVLIVGAGAGGLGVAKIIRAGMLAAGMSEVEVRSRLFVADVNGLLLGSEELEQYKREFAQRADYCRDWQTAAPTPSLLEIVRHIQPSVLLGLSGAPGIFHREIIETLAQQHARPVVFPFSNPNSLCEAVPADIIAWSDGRAIVATGSPFDDVHYQGRRYEIRQGNNAFIFPGLGLAAVIGECSRISDGMVLAAAYGLVEYVDAYCEQEHIFPPIRELKKISALVAQRVLAAAIADGSASADLADRDLAALVAEQMWQAEYLPCRYVGK
jgi:malate dehydrogenase (oxaloacetate-decarboxylating)